MKKLSFLLLFVFIGCSNATYSRIGEEKEINVKCEDIHTIWGNSYYINFSNGNLNQFKVEMENAEVAKTFVVGKHYKMRYTISELK